MDLPFQHTIKDTSTVTDEVVKADLSDGNALAINTYKEQQSDVQAITERQNNVAQATFFDSEEKGFVGEKWRAFSNSWDETWLAKGIDYFEHDRAFFRDTNEEFVASWDDKAQLDFVKNKGLGLDAVNTIRDAVSMEHAEDLASMLIKDNDRQNQINNALTSTEKIISSLVTSVADVDIIIGGIGALGAKVANSTVKTASVLDKVNKGIASGTAATELGYGAFISAVDDDISLGEAMLFSTIIGAVDYSIVRRLSDADTMKLAQSVVDAPSMSTMTRNEQIKNMVDTAVNTERASPTARNKAMSDMLDEMDSVKPNEAKIARLQKEIDALDDIGKTKPKTLTSLDEMKRVEILKEAIKKRLAYAKTIGFKQIHAKMKESINLKLSDTELRLIHQEKQDVLELSSKIEMDITLIKNDLESLAKGDVDTASEVLSVYEKLHNNGHISKSTFEQLQSSFKKGRDGEYKRPSIEIKDSGYGKPMEIKINKKSTGIKVGYALGASLIATSAFAYDGSDMASDYGIILLAGIAGIAGIKNAKNIAKYISKAAETSKLSKAMDKTKSLRTKLSTVANETRTSLTETIKPLLDSANTPELKDLISKIYFNPIETGRTVERIKNRIYHAHWNTLQKDMKGHFTDWLKTDETSKFNATLSLFTSRSKRAEFDELVSEYIEYGRHADNEAVVNGAGSVNRILDSMMGEMKASGIKDIDKTILVKNYLPRQTRNSHLASVLSTATPSSRDAFVKEFAKMLTKTDNAEDVAKAYIDAMTDPLSGFGKKKLTSIEEIRETMAKKGFDESVADEIADALGVGGDKFKRIKSRLFMEKQNFKTVTINNVDGGVYEATIKDIFETDIMNMMSGYLNTASGHVAFADMGFKSIDEAIEVVANSKPDMKTARTILNDIEALTGSPVVDYSQTANRIMRDVSNYTMAIKMQFSALSLSAEALTTAFKLNKSGWRGTFSGLTSKLRSTYGDDSFMMKSLAEEDGLGIGTHQYGATYGAYKQIDEFGNISGGETGLNMFSKVGEFARDVTLHTLPFVRISDFLTKVNIQDSVQVLYNHVNDIKGLKDYEKVSFAITDQVEKIAKKLELNSSGHVKYFDMSKLSRDDSIALKTTLDAMLQKRIQQATMGTTGAWSRQTALGVVASNLIKFPMSAYSNIGSFLGRGAMAGDPSAMLQTSLWFGGGAIASILRKELKGQDYTEEDIIVDALLSHPFAGAYGTAIGVLNPAPTKAMSDVQEAVNIYNYR